MCLPACLPECLFSYLLVYLLVYLSGCLTVYLPVCLPACASLCVSLFSALTRYAVFCSPTPPPHSLPRLLFPFSLSLCVFFCSPPPSLSDLALLSSSLVLNRVFRFVSELVHDSQEATFLGLLRGVCCYSVHPSRFPVVLGYSAMFLTLAIDTEQSIAALSSSLPGLDIVTALADSHPD